MIANCTFTEAEIMKQTKPWLSLGISVKVDSNLVPGDFSLAWERGWVDSEKRKFNEERKDEVLTGTIL